MNERSFGLRTQILAVVLGVAILPLALVGAWLTTSGVRSGEDLLRDHLNASADRYVAVMLERWEFRQGDIGLLAGNEATQRVVAGGKVDNADREFLDYLATGFSATIPTIEIRDLAQRVRWASTPALRGRGEEIANPIAVGPVLRIRRPIVDASGKQLGELRADLLVNALAPADSARPLVPGGQLTLRDRATRTMIVPLRPTVRYPDGDKIEIAGAQWLVVHRTLDAPGIDLAVGAPLAPYVARFKSVGRVGMAALMLVCLVAIGAALLLTRRIMRPLENLAEASDAVTRGNLERRASLGGPTEVRRVGTAFNAMTENLRRTLDEIGATLSARCGRRIRHVALA